MTPESDVVPTPHSEILAQATAGAVVTPVAEPGAPVSLFQEINERRARIEKPELLRHLRGL